MQGASRPQVEEAVLGRSLLIFLVLRTRHRQFAGLPQHLDTVANTSTAPWQVRIVVAGQDRAHPPSTRTTQSASQLLSRSLGGLSQAGRHNRVRHSGSRGPMNSTRPWSAVRWVTTPTAGPWKPMCSRAAARRRCGYDNG